MTKRLFYTCAIKAAFMAKYFEVRFLSEKGQVLEFRGTSDFWAQKDQGIYMGERFYVHPDSMQVFEPVDGDRDEDGRTYRENVRGWILELGSTFRGEACGILGRLYTTPAIRNGRPFI